MQCGSHPARVALRSALGDQYVHYRGQEVLVHDFLIFTCKQNAPIAEMKLPKRPRKGATLHALTAKQLIKELEVADVRPRQ